MIIDFPLPEALEMSSTLTSSIAILDSAIENAPNLKSGSDDDVIDRTVDLLQGRRDTLAAAQKKIDAALKKL